MKIEGIGRRATGSYQLLIHLANGRRITVGKLGSFWFEAGYYLYTGSALGGLEARVARHLRQTKKLHWHVDYLLQWASVVDVRLFEGSGRIECELAKTAIEAPGAGVPVSGFGSSDCRCRSHLVYLGGESIGDCSDSMRMSSRGAQRRGI